MGLKQMPKCKEQTCRFCQNGKYCIRADHDYVAVGKVKHFCNAVNHGVAQRDKRIDSSQTEAINKCAYKRTHYVLSLKPAVKQASMAEGIFTPDHTVISCNY